MKKHLMKSVGVIGGSTFLSRCLGLVRDVVSARQFGTSWQWDAFIYAFMIPNFFRRLVGEGALSSAFIPVYSEILAKEGKEAAFKFANAALTILLVGLTSTVLLGEIALSIVLQVEGLSPRIILTIELLQRLFPYLMLISVFALGMGILNTHKHFFVPSFAPVILNLFWIAGVLWIAPRGGSEFALQLKVLAWMLVAAGFMQVLSEIPLLFRYGFRFRPVWDFAHHGIRQTGKLLIPAVIGFAVMQINMLVDMSLAFIIGPGASSSLWYGTRIMQFPLGIFAIGMGTALLPMISEQAARQDWMNTSKTMSFALRVILLIILPASIGLIVLAKPIVKLLFERGEFDAISTARSASVLVCYSIGLFAYSGQKIMTAGFHGAQDTKTPVKIGAIALISNVILNLILMIPLKEAGLALATSISGILQFILLFIFYGRGFVKLETKEIGFAAGKILIAALIMGAGTYALYQALNAIWLESELIPFIFKIAVSMGSSVLLFFGLCFIFRVQEVKDLIHWKKT